MTIYNRTKRLELTPAITAGSYSSGDVLGGLLQFNVASPGGGGVLRRMVIADDDNEKAGLTLYFFSAAPTTFADNAAFSPTFADLQKLIDVVSVVAGDYVTVNSNAYVIKSGLNLDYAVSGEVLYAYAVTTGTPTYTATSDLSINLLVWAD